MNHQEAFLKALAENEDDTMTRMVYADWLEERGEHEESERQRNWPAAKAWLVRFCEVNNPAPDDEWETEITYEELLSLGKEAVESNQAYAGFSCGNNMTMCDALRTHTKRFWTNWSIVTGIPLPPGFEETAGFHCAC